jgi:hypothetical protein
MNKRKIMKTKTIKVCDAIHVDVSCEENDSTDIKCGGPAMLGYDFFVSPDENCNELCTFIKKCLKTYGRPLINIIINAHEDFPIKKLWTRKMIEKCIKEHNLGI